MLEFHSGKWELWGRNALSAVIDLRNGLTAEDDCNQEIEHLNDFISDMEAEMKRNKIMKQFKGISEDPGSIKLKYGKY